MEGFGGKWKIFRSLAVIVWSFALAAVFVSAERSFKKEGSSLINNAADESESNFVFKCVNFLWQSNQSGYQHVWPELEFNWQIVVASIIGFCGAAFGSVGGVGGGGIFVPMLTLIIGFDPKSATAISKCMIMGAAVSTVYYNLKLRHPTIDMPIIDYDLAVLIQPMLMLGISIGVAFNVLFADWMVTVLLIVLFIGTSTKAFLKGVDTWKGETILKKEAASRLEDNGNGGEGADYKLLPGGPDKAAHGTKTSLKEEVSILENVCYHPIACNEKCEQEVAVLSDGRYTASVAYQFPSSLPSWLERPELNTTRASDDKANDSMVLSAKVVRLQKKWDNICQRLHFAPFLAKPDTYRVYSQVPTIMGFQVVQDGKDNVSSHHANASSIVAGCKVVESSRLTDAELNAAAEASAQVIVNPKPMNVRFRESANSDEQCALRTPLKSWSSSNVVEGLTSPTSITSVTTDLGLRNNFTSRVIEKSPNQSQKDLMQDFSGCLPENSDVPAASTKNNVSITSSFPSSDLCEQYDEKDYKYLYTSLFSKIGRQEDAMAVISQTLARCKSGNGKRKGASRGDMWFNFLGSDGICQKKTAIALAEILYGGTESFICVDLSFKDGVNHINSLIGWQDKNNCDVKFRGKTMVDYIADQLRRKPLSVVFLENIDRSDPQVQSSLLYALKSGRLVDSHGREVSTSNAVFVTTSRSIEEKKIAPSTEETFSYSEENVVATKGRPIQILIGFDLGDNVISQNTRVLNKTKKNDSIPVFLNKRKLVANDGNIRQHKATEVVKRPHTATKISLDLNLPAEEIEMTDVEDFDREPLSENVKSWLDEFLTLGDETVIFKPFDFNALAEEKLKVITQCFHNIVGSEGSLEVDSQVVEQILATVYLSDSSKVDDWINQVLGQAFVEARKTYNLNSRSVVKVIPCEVQEAAQGALLPARIIMN